MILRTDSRVDVIEELGRPVLRVKTAINLSRG
ncbi:hypothetical protein LCGC14_2670700, partial [marine sediment metagenome]